MPPKVLIIGAGLSGLTLAQSLRSNNIPFKIFDRDESISSRAQGYAVLIHKLVPTLRNLAHKDAPPLESVNVSAGSGAVEGFAVYTSSGEATIRGGADTYLNFLRANRLRLRKWLATGIDVQWNTNFTKCERNEDGTVTALFADGSTEKGDILVGADGVSSPVRNNIYQPNPPKYSIAPVGLIGGELTLSHEDYLHQCSLAQSFYIAKSSSFNFFGGLSSYAPSQSRYYWLLSWDDENAGAPDFWVNSAKPEELLAFARDALKEFDPKFRRLLELQDLEEMMTSFSFKELMPRPLSEEDAPWTIIGDAAHAMTPFQAQGANEAMQDAVELSARIVEASSGNMSYAEALRKYEQEMVPRTTNAVEGSRRAWKGNSVVNEHWKQRSRGGDV